MRLTFQLRFHTHPGQSLFLGGDHELFGGGDPGKALPLQYFNETIWQVTFILPRFAVPRGPLTYHYLLREMDGSMAQDWDNGRSLDLASLNSEDVVIIDSWNYPGYVQNAFYTSPFREVLLRANHREFLHEPPARGTHRFRVRAPLLTSDQTLCITGQGKELGNWNTSAPVLMNRSAGEDFLSATVDLSAATFPLAYKYGVYALDTKAFLQYEEGPDRVLTDPPAPGRTTLVDDGFVRLPATGWKGAGVAIPVFSLRSEKSFGVGEFSDLKPLGAWCQRVGLRLIQILPVNDTTATGTWTDSYPYAAISAFALHPIYLNLSEVAEGENVQLLKAAEPERQRLNALSGLDYEAVTRAKLKLLKEIFPSQRAKTLACDAYREFLEENRAWLLPYAAFCYLRDRYGTADFTQWPEHSRYQTDAVAALAAPGSPACGEIEFTCFLQYHLHVQLRKAAGYLHDRGIILKGDIPIGVSRCSVDTWQQPGLYHMDMQAGAPPDAFGVRGQNWSFPTYNWPQMKADGFAWWKARFEQMSRYFDAFRIDHILGFFRIWSIPTHAVEGILGYFVPALPVREAEFKARGIRFDRERFTQPYITDKLLTALFAEDARRVKASFLDPHPGMPGQYVFKPAFATQRQVEHFLAARKDGPRLARLKQGLFELLSNVILFEVEDPEGAGFHFRFGIKDTSSFQELDADTRAKLSDLYLDYFYRRQDEFWMREALQKLPALKRVTNMLVCGEDLGMVPDCVPEVMRRLGLLSLEIQRMPKRLGLEFFNPREAPYLSVVTPSSHDMSTVRAWWEEDPAVTRRFWNRELGQAGEAPAHCEPWICRAIVRQHLDSPAMWSIFQLQDLLGMDDQLRRADATEERINVPANPKNYWRYRMHLTLEALSRADRFADSLKFDIQASGR